MPRVAYAASPQAEPILPDNAAIVCDTIVMHGIGGLFWGRRMPRPFTVVLSLPGDCPLSPARAALAPLLARHPRDRILLLVPRMYARTRWLARTLGLACVAACEVDPHDLARTVREVWAMAPATYQHDLCILIALHGHQITFLDSDGRPERTFDRSAALNQLMRQTRYVCPFTGRPISCLELLNLLLLWKQVMGANRQIGACMGMSLWKRPQISAFLATPEGSPAFFHSIRRAIAACRKKSRNNVAIWATRMPPQAEEYIHKAGRHLLRVEDGFVRSLGLGSALNPPSSIFLDSRGIYYDPATESDLEHILATYDFDADIRARAEKLIARLHASGISKYDRGEKPTAPATGTIPARRRNNRPVILVPGQVADDLSVLRGGGQIRDNLSLLRAVRMAHPDAHIIYRPHPDVDGGYRKGAIPDAVVLTLADEINRKGAITTLLARVDAVHTLTSLAGFEALIRAIPVTTYGTPFYAGWGLTEDRGRIPTRRNRQLLLTELVAGALLLYPRYLDPVTRLPCPIEVLLDRFEEPTFWKPTVWTHLRKIQIRFFQMARQGRTVTDHFFHRVHN